MCCEISDASHVIFVHCANDVRSGGNAVRLASRPVEGVAGYLDAWLK